MTNLEHVIENTLKNFKAKKSAEEIFTEIPKDINFVEQPLTANQIYEICQYFWCTYLDCGNLLQDDPEESSRLASFSTSEVHMLERQAIEASPEIVLSGRYTEKELAVHEKLLNELAEELKQRNHRH